MAEEQQRWQAEKAELEKTVCGLQGEMGALQAQREELQATLDTLASGQPGIDTKVSSGQDVFSVPLSSFCSTRLRPRAKQN